MTSERPRSELPLRGEAAELPSSCGHRRERPTRPGGGSAAGSGAVVRPEGPAFVTMMCVYCMLVSMV